MKVAASGSASPAWSTVAGPRLRARKLPYYLRLLARLSLELQPRHQVLARLLRPRGDVDLRAGRVLRLEDRLDLLVLAEIVCDDVYRLRELDAETTLIVDVGAGLGDFAVSAAGAFPRARVVAIEPDPGRFALLQLNVARNGLANVELHQAAAGRPAISGQPLGWFPRGEQVDLLKIDCEGAEVDVLLGLAAEELARVRRVALEWHRSDDALRDEQVAQILSAEGFRVLITTDPYEPMLGYAYAKRAVDAGTGTED